ncbi:STM4015 family protein [Streptomyces sp. NPDC059786]|uniref:STM4015 family protein n=1 Tax=Streptomyces sp. NPDC059786 TaxID=3346946 RepID=UPI003646BDB1
MLDHLSHFHGLPIHDFADPADPASEQAGPLPAADEVAWRLARHELWEPEEEFEDAWERFLDTVDVSKVRALVLGAGAYGIEDDAASPDETAQRLAAAADRFTGLRALYLADLTYEESELSWILQSDVNPILSAYPRLEELGVRGSDGLRFSPLRHEHLRVLRLENGGLPAEVVHGLTASDLPALDHLDLWLGDESYGRTTTVGDLAPLLAGGVFPALRRLGLQDCDIQDEIAAAVAHAPVVSRLSSLHLGLGTLSDAGAQALLGGRPLTHLEVLDLEHHFLSEPMMRRLREALEPSGVRVNLDDRQETRGSGGRRYVAAGE